MLMPRRAAIRCDIFDMGSSSGRSSGEPLRQLLFCGRQGEAADPVFINIVQFLWKVKNKGDLLDPGASFKGGLDAARLRTRDREISVSQYLFQGFFNALTVLFSREIAS
jgi:hypothetical protein